MECEPIAVVDPACRVLWLKFSPEVPIACVMPPAAPVPAPAVILDRAETVRSLRRSLSHARRIYAEQPEAALIEAMRCHEVARSHAELGLAARALTLQGILSVHRGDLRSGVALARAAAAKADHSGDVPAQAEVAALRALLSFFTGGFAEAVSEAQAALGLADRVGETELRLFVRRLTCPVFGNLGAGDLRDQLELTLVLAGDDAREQALCHNDLGTMLAEQGDLTGADVELERAFSLLRAVPEARFALAGVHITRAEVRLASGDSRGALLDSRRGIELLALDSNPNPYLLGAAIRTEVQALIDLGAVDDAQRLGEGTLVTLGDRLPQMRSMILTILADALHRGGRLEEAYATLARASELEREAFRELADLQLGLERVTLEAHEARRHSDDLMARNRQLANAHAELERRSLELERLQEQLLDQAERDWLTGLHNRRFLERRLDEIERLGRPGPVSISIVDIDNFKAINDSFGHCTGDQVLAAVARVLESLLRRRDTSVRSGGEEFVLVMPDTDHAVAVLRCERIRQRIAAQPWNDIVPGLTVTASIGVGWTNDPRQVREVVRDADQALYRAKRGGRNRVESGETAPEGCARRSSRLD